MTNKYEQWAEAKFQGLTRDELRDAGKVFGLTFGPNTSDANMRIKLCEKIGAAAPVEPAPVVAESGKRPNLSPQGRWEGRRRRVILSRGPMEAQHKAKVLVWDTVTRAFPYDEMIDMPEPWFNVMKDAINAHVFQKKVLNDDGQLERMEKQETPYPMHTYRDLGVTPGTEHLPGDLQEYWREQAKKTNYFKSYSRPSLIKIRADFVGSVGLEAYRDLTNEEIRFDVLRHCNLENVILELEQLEHAA